MYNKKIKIGVIIVFLLLVTAGICLVNYYNLIPKEYFTSEHFNIDIIHSSVDFNNNGVDDYTDILLGARQDAENKPRYDGSYYDGGYPPDDIGVCTDVIWRAFAYAGYFLKDMVDQDIRENTDLYPAVEGKPDSNIDFRRVPNLKVFFERYAASLTLDSTEIEKWQPGDIVIYNESHIGIVSDRRNEDGVPYIIHNAGQPIREEDVLTRRTISGHFRFDASQIEESDLVPYIEA